MTSAVIRGGGDSARSSVCRKPTGDEVFERVLKRDVKYHFVIEIASLKN
jgi:hypothetical protein